jgi:hypothetical protein
MATTTLFQKLYKLGAAALKALDSPRQSRLIGRAFDAVGDKADKVKDDTDGSINKLYLDLSTAPTQEDAERIITKIAEAQVKYESAVNVSAKIPAIKTSFLDTLIEDDGSEPAKA